MSIVQPIRADLTPAPVVADTYKTKWGYRFAAYALEGTIIGGSCYMGYLFANKYAPAQFDPDWMKMMVGTGIIATMECARIPVVVAARKAKTYLGKLPAWAMVGAITAVSAYGLSQVLQQKFEPRLIEVTTAANALKTQVSKVASLDPVSLRAQIKALDDRKNSLSKDLEVIGKRPADKTERYQVLTRIHGKVVKLWRSRSVPQSWDGAKTQEEMTKLSAQRDALSVKLASADGELGKSKVELTKAEAEYANAVMRSQLHQFASMLMMKAPTDVTDKDVAITLFWMVLIASIAAALAGTALAAASVEVIRAPKPKATQSDPKLSSGIIETISKMLDARISRALYENGVRSKEATSKVA